VKLLCVWNDVVRRLAVRRSIGSQIPKSSSFEQQVINSSVSVAGNQHSIPKDRLSAVAMIGWRVARHWAAGDGGGAPLFYQNGVDVEEFSNLTIGFPFFRN